MAATMRLGVVGYGVGGRFFHTPFIEAAEGVELAGVVTRSAQRRALVEQDWPGVPTYDTLTALLESGVDAVTITTPPETRRALVLESLAADVHVLADKPFAPSAEAAQQLARTAKDAGVILNVFHNRRWDADIRTLAAVLAGGWLGDLWRVHTRFDLDQPHLLEPGPGGRTAARPGQPRRRPDAVAARSGAGGDHPPGLGRPTGGEDRCRLRR